MNTYAANWKGLDRGHEGVWHPAIWYGVLNIFNRFSPVDLSKPESEFYSELKTKCPKISWLSQDGTSGFRNFFRDGREPWASTDVVSFDEHSNIATITDLGKKVTSGSMTYSDVLARTLLYYNEGGEYPVRVILNALRTVHERGLSVEDVVRVMQHYRDGDNLSEVLQSPEIVLTKNSLRRIRAIMLLLVYSGLAIEKEKRYYLGHDPTVAVMANLLPIKSLRDEFKDWLANVYKKPDGSVLGSTAMGAYVRALDSATTPDPHGAPASSHLAVVWYNIYQHLYGIRAPKGIFAIDNVEEYDNVFGGLKVTVSGGTKPAKAIDVHFTEIQQWVSGQSGGAFLPPAMDLYAKFLKWREAQKKKEEPPVLPAADRLTIALRVFAEKRHETEWQDKTRIDGYRNIYDMAAMTPEQIAAGSLDDFYNDFLLKIWAFKNGGSRRYGQLDDAGKVAYRDFVVEMKKELKSFDAYFPPDKKCPDGMGVGVLTELLMRFWPKSCCSYNSSLIHDGLVVLGMAEGDFVWPKTPSIYQDFMGKCATILLRMEQMKLPRRPDPDNDEPPDYFTVNEFLWFVHEYKDTISKECEAKMMKKADYSQATSKPAGKKPKVDFGNAEDVVLLRLAAALRAKPFAILAGHSGTGKSRMVRKLAYMTCARGGYKALLEGADGKPAATPGNFCMVQVKPNWHDSTDLLGYYSEIGSAFRTTDFVKFICKAYSYPDVPFFVCLDEMNLAPVEQYFAEYLSAIESRKVKDDAEFLDGNGDEKTGPKVITDTLLDKSVWKSASDLGCEFTQSAYWVEKHGLTIPRNLFVVGTVNMDESTNQFSRKVLDRAFTLEMTDADFEHFGEKNPELSYSDFAGDDFAKALLDGEVVAKKPEAGAPQQEKDTFANQVKKLTSLQPVLDGTSFVVAYRFANEYMLYANALGKMCDVMDVSGDAAATSGEAKPVEAAAKRPDAFDDMILMKVLPRITGDTEMVMRIFAGDPGQDKEPRALDDADVGGLAKLLGKESASFGKMKEIVKRGESSGSGTLTFWP